MKLAAADPSLFRCFRFASAEDVLCEASTIPDGVGVYAIFLKEAETFLLESGFGVHRVSEVARLDEGLHVYTGESWGIRSRLRRHLNGDIVASNMRMTLMALQAGGVRVFCDDLPKRYADAEHLLSEWLSRRAVVAYKSCGLTRDVERTILAKSPSPLNIAGRDADAFARRLKADRRVFSKHAFMVEARALASRPKRYRR